MEHCMLESCGKKLTHVEGRKQKSFCDVNCRNKYFYSKRKKLIETALSVGCETNAQNITPPTKELKPAVEEKPNDVTDIQKQIASIRAEKVPKERDTIIGRKSWSIEQEKRIKELKEKITNPHTYFLAAQ